MTVAAATAEVAAHVNFYENTAEVQIRLVGTVVLYDDKPYYVLCASDHKKDGIIRIYLDDLSHPEGPAHLRVGGIPYQTSYDIGVCMDKWLELNPDTGVVRKMMNSPHFKKYRPFPLGMCNFQGKVIYVERNPTRQTNQGLNQQMLQYHLVSLVDTKKFSGNSKYGNPVFPTMLNREFADMVRGEYPSAQDTIENLLDKRTENEGAGFHRNFALLKGPMDSLYLAYKENVVGLLTYGDLSVVKIGPAYRHTKEAVRDLGIFQTVE